jgi:hypothetical protein
MQSVFPMAPNASPASCLTLRTHSSDTFRALTPETSRFQAGTKAFTNAVLEVSSLVGNTVQAQRVLREVFGVAAAAPQA